MAGFEKACRNREIVLYVLPPRSPKLNGGVERVNGTWRREFRECDDLPGINGQVDGFANLYNHHRPHGALQGRTPAENLSTVAESGGGATLSTELNPDKGLTTRVAGHTIERLTRGKVSECSMNANSTFACNGMEGDPDAVRR